MKTALQLLLILTILVAMLSVLQAEKPVKRGLLVAGTDMFWETFDAEFNSCPSEEQAAILLRMKGYEVYE